MAELIDSLGRPIHDLRISVTDRCNFRWTYCMPNVSIDVLDDNTFKAINDVDLSVQQVLDGIAHRSATNFTETLIKRPCKLDCLSPTS